MQMWKRFNVELQFTGFFAASTPKHPKDIEAMLLSRAPSQVAIEKREAKGESITPLPELAEQVKEEVEATEEIRRGYATFKRDEEGLYYEARCVKGHLKDCAEQLRPLLGISAFKPKVANKVYVEPIKIPLYKKDVAGHEIRFVQALTPRGKISAPKVFDYIDKPLMKFQLRVLNDGIITENMLKEIFEYGGVHGMGQERGQDFGRYELVKLEEAPHKRGK